VSLHKVDGKLVPCNAYQVRLSFDGAPAVLRIRVFVDEGKVIGVRSLNLVDPDGGPIRRWDRGSIDALEDVEYGAPPKDDSL